MVQRSLPFGKPTATRRTRLDVQAKFDADNKAAAEIILTDNAKYGGPESLMVQWATAIIRGEEARRSERTWRLVA